MPEKSEDKEQEKGQLDRAPYQKDGDRDAVKSAEETKHIPNKHGALK